MIGEPCTRGSLFLVSTAHLPRRAPTSLRQHCKDCKAYGTLDTRDQERAHKRATVEFTLAKPSSPLLNGPSVSSTNSDRLVAAKASRSGAGSLWNTKRVGLSAWPLVSERVKRGETSGSRCRLSSANTQSAYPRIIASTSSRFCSISARLAIDSRFSRSSGSVFEPRTLKCQLG
jgi:hypothetical protein